MSKKEKPVGVNYSQINDEEKNIRIKYGKDFRIVGYYTWENTLKDLAGKTLTIIDASFTDVIQRKAVKDLIKQNFWKVIYDCQSDYFEGNAGHSVQLEDK
jgi:hypothetical protein